MRRIIPVLLGVAVPITAIAPALLLAVDDYVIGESEANISYDAGFLGYWRYDLTVTWDVTAYPDGGHDLSHMSFVIGLEDCPIACRNGYFVFPDTAGSSLGGGGCTVYYYVEFNCTGDPTIPEPVPTIKFEPYDGFCEPDRFGTASVFFYSLAPPRPAEGQTSSVWIKFGRYIEDGRIEGVLPSCTMIPNAAEGSTWSSIKSLFR